MIKKNHNIAVFIVFYQINTALVSIGYLSKTFFFYTSPTVKFLTAVVHFIYL